MGKYVPRTRPFRHQSKATLLVVRRFLRGEYGFALFMEPRTGKSKAALDAVGILRQRNEITRVAILCPKVALEVWDQQIKIHFPFRAELEDHQYQWTRNGGRRPGHTTRFYLLGYERASRRERRGRRWARPYLAEVERWGADVIVLDESHRLKRAGGVTSGGLWRMVRRLRRKGHDPARPFVLLLTGTPTPKGWIDLFAQFRILDERILGTSKAGFEDKHVQFSKNPRQPWRIVRYRNERQLERRIRAHSFSISQDEAGLARKQFTQNLSVQLPKEIKAQYDELAKYFITQIGDQIVEGKNAGAVRTRLLQVTGGFTTSGRVLHHAKLERFADWCGVVVEQQDPLVVYCRFLPEVAACMAQLEKLGFRAYDFTGSTKDRHRRMALKAMSSYVRGARPPAIVFQVQAGSLALDLADAAEVVFYSLPDGWEAYWQSRNRVLGPRQTRPVRFTHLIAKGTLDLSVLRNLQRKEDLHATMMRNPRRYLTGL